MGRSIYFADPAVAAAYHVNVGGWAWVADDAEAGWLLEQRHGYDAEHPTAVPAAGHVHPDAPMPFVAYGAAPPPSPKPSPKPAPALIQPASER